MKGIGVLILVNHPKYQEGRSYNRHAQVLNSSFLSVSSVLSVVFLIVLISSCLIPSLVARADEKPLGPLRYCQRTPQFVSALGIHAPAFMTSHRTLMGLVLFDGTKSFDHQKPYQDPSWSRFGWLGPMAFDGAGNIYLTSVPHVNVLSNPLAQQNDLFRVGTTSGVLERLISLPVKQQPSLSNPYGAVGIAYDCDTDILYLSTLSGSTRDKQNGAVFAITLRNNQILDSISGFDPLGITIFRAKSGKRIYFGSARRSEVLSLALRDDGRFAAEPEQLLTFDKFNATRARKFSFDKALNMTVETIEFNFNLIASTQLEQHKYIYRYDSEGDKWISTSAEP